MRLRLVEDIKLLRTAASDGSGVGNPMDALIEARHPDTKNAACLWIAVVTQCDT